MSASQRLRMICAVMAVGDLLFLGAILRRWRVTERFVGTAGGELAVWSAGVVGTYTLAQAAIAIRPTAAGARAMAALRATLIGGDLMLLMRGRSVDRRLMVPVAMLNGTLALTAWRASEGDVR